MPNLPFAVHRLGMPSRGIECCIIQVAIIADVGVTVSVQRQGGESTNMFPAVHCLDVPASGVQESVSEFFVV